MFQFIAAVTCGLLMLGFLTAYATWISFEIPKRRREKEERNK